MNKWDKRSTPSRPVLPVPIPPHADYEGWEWSTPSCCHPFPPLLTAQNNNLVHSTYKSWSISMKPKTSLWLLKLTQPSGIFWLKKVWDTKVMEMRREGYLWKILWWRQVSLHFFVILLVACWSLPFSWSGKCKQ